MARNGHVEEFRQVGGARIQLLRGGQGPPLVFLHGAAGAGIWLPFLAALARHFTVHAPSHPGFGRSEDPEWLDTIDDLVHFYLDFLDDLGHSKVHLVGLSLGGWIAAELATVCSHRIGRLVLVDAAGIRLDGVTVPDLFIMPPEEAARTIFADPATAAAIYPADPTAEQLEILLRQRSTLARLAWNPYLHNPKLLRRLPRIRVPTLVVWGEGDRLLPLEHARAFQQAIPGARLAVLPGCGHVPPLDRPEDFARAVTGFLEER
ncbi:MAG TPA: alpha/beta fold hydrolase [Candidatus Methylomirabilis sp.]|jgi:pimeloyl-ACP methyl ester carboxylesterase